jgi:cellulose synthase/poly-beta-1,6-N-acetylglucosamine synthase-like glycosyltransferase
MDNSYYLKIGNASDLKDPKERFIFRLFEIVPGFLSWLIILSMVILSFAVPLLAVIFILSFVLFWFLKIFYFSIHLIAGYKKLSNNMKADWLGMIKAKKNWENIFHLIIVPMHKEPLEIVASVFESLEKSDYPKEKMIVVLACEEAARESVLETADVLQKRFGKSFFRFIQTWHPADIEGELAGKGSNETWAAKISEDEIRKMGIPFDRVIFSSLDADTCVYPKYFSCLTYNYLTCEKPERTSFQPIPLYLNSIWQAPAFSRVFSFSATFWHTMNQGRPDKLVTFSSHSMSFKTLIDVGFKQTNIVSDDSRIFWQCFLKYNGDYSVFPLHYPVSMDANFAEGFLKTTANIYKQQRRWAYGACEIPYFFFGAWKRGNISLKKMIAFGIELIEGHVSWAVASFIVLFSGWLPLAFGGEEFSHSLVSYHLPLVISRIMTFSNIGLISSVYFSFLLLPPKPVNYGNFKYLFFALSWLFLPITMIAFGSLPALDAQTRLMFGKYMGFWPTEKIRRK